MANKGNDTRIRCSFCGKTDDQVRKLIAGPDDTFICDECIGLCSEIINEELKQPYDEALAGEINLLKPQEIKEILDEFPILIELVWVSVFQLAKLLFSFTFLINTVLINPK